MGLSDAMRFLFLFFIYTSDIQFIFFSFFGFLRTMVRIGKVYSSEELTVWCCLMKHCEEVPDTIKYNNVWVNSIEIMLDFEQPVYRSNDNSSSVWETCCCAFFEEDGFDMLVNQLDCHAFDKLTPELVSLFYISSIILFLLLF